MRVHACERRCLHLALLLAGFAPLSNAQTIQWDGGAGGGTAWLTGTNWAGDATPGALNTAEFAGAGTATIIGVTMSNPTNNGTANQIVGMIRQVGGSARTVRNGSTTTPGTLTLAGVGGVLLENTSANNLSITDGTSQVMNLQFQSAGNINVTSSGLITISSSIIGTNGFVKTGSGRLDLTNSGGSSHTGTVTLQEGTLRIANGAAALGALPTSPTQVVFLEAGTFIADTTSNSGTNRQFGIGPASGAGAATIETPAGREFTISGVIGDNNAGTGSLIKTGDGTLVLGNGSNTYSGTTTIQAGVLSISSGTSLGPAPGSPAEKIFINGGSLRLAASFALSSNRGIVIGPSSGSGTGTIDVPSGITATYSGVLANNGAGTGSFVKSGDGELRLGGTSTITGTITVSAGNLQVGVSNAGSVGSGGVTVSTGATMSGTGTILGTIATNHSMGGTLRPGDSGGASMGTFKAQGNLVFTPAASTFMQVASPSSTFDKVQGLTSGGTMTLDGTVKVDFESYTPAAGDSWQIFDWSVLNMSAFNSGTNLRSGFDGVDEGDLDLPDVTLQSLLWDLSSFSSGGILSLVSVPEPSRMVQVLLGIAVLLRRRGRDQPTRCT